MLEVRRYTYDELVQIYKTDRLDKIKKHIVDDGYCMEKPEGRGKKIVITISALPKGKNKLKVYCRDVLKFKPNKDYDKLCAFLRKLLFDENFKNLRTEQMSAELSKEGIYICEETLSDYFHHLQELGMYQFIYGDFLYEARSKNDGQIIQITREQYNDFYKIYHQIQRKDEELAERYKSSMYGSMPRKRLLPIKNCFYSEHFNNLITIFEEEGLVYE